MKRTTDRQNVTGNRDSGSLHVGHGLPQQFRKNGLRPEAGTLQIKIDGEADPRNVTWIMGSEAKGFSLCTKGAPPFPKDLSYVLVYEDAE